MARTRTLAAIAAAACPPLLLLALGLDRAVPEFDSIDELYRTIAGRVARGEVPYRDFLLEYPVGCLPQILLPGLAGGGVLAYRTAYIAEMLVANALLILAVAGEVERNEGRAAVPRRLGWYLLGFLFLARLIVSRLDVVPALLGFAAAVAWSRGRPIRGGALAAIGGLVKLFPAMAALPAGWREIGRGGEGRPAGLIAFASVFAVGMAGWGILGGFGVLDAILFHAGRGLEIESTAAGVLMLAGRAAGISMALETGHGSIDLDAPWSAGAVVASRCVQVVAMMATMAAFVRPGGRSVVRCTGALLLAGIAAAPVFSPQFLIWVLPFVIALGGPAGRRARPLFAFAAALTFLIYPVLFVGGLLPMRIPAILALNLRNAAVIGLWWVAAFGRDAEGASIPVEVDDRAGGS